MIDTRKLKELVRLMVDNDLTELDLRDNEQQVTLRRQGRNEPMLIAPQGNAHPVGQVAPQAPQATPAQQEAAADREDGEDDLVAIESPMVGTFYAKPSPDAQPFVTVGATVADDTVVCLVEAMKIFNEIKAETSGTVRRVLVENGQSVEFGQPLFMVQPD